MTCYIKKDVHIQNNQWFKECDNLFLDLYNSSSSLIWLVKLLSTSDEILNINLNESAK